MLGLSGKRQRVNNPAINLALQGGGVHGAFTWGVLDRLLEEDQPLEFAWISATSAGAVNAAAVASGLAHGGAKEGRQQARRTLRTVWEAVQEAAAPDLVRLNPFLRSLGRSSSMAPIAAMFSPYDFNPLGFDPLRRILGEHIDFERIRSSAGPELLIAATDVATGAKRLFRRAELTVDAVLASACLPTIHHAVEIDGRAYWDGGFSANPDLITLATESPAEDTLVVLLNGFDEPGLPRSSREIAAAISRITFNQPLRRDIELIEAARAAADEAARAAADLGWWKRARTLAPARHLGRHRFHLVEAGHHTALLPADSKIQPDRTTISRLFLAGHTEASKWLERHSADVGLRSTVDLAQHLGKISNPITRTDEAVVPLNDDDRGPAPPRSAPASGS